MSEDPTQELPRKGSFEARVLAEFAALRGEVTAVHEEVAAVHGEFVGVRGEVAALRGEVAAVREEVAEVRADIARLDLRQQKFEERLTTLEEKVDSRLSETRPIWESVQLAIKRLDSKFDIVLSDLYDVRANYKNFDKRLTELEAR